MSVEFDGNGSPDEAANLVQGSLASRMKSRARELEGQATETFSIPGWEDILAVELRLVSWSVLRGIGQRNARVKQVPLQELYTACDAILTATVQHFEVKDDGKHESIDDTWMSLARRTGKALPEDLTPRQAMIALVGDTRIMVLFNEWQEWMQGERRAVGDEVVLDFGMTSSPTSSTTQ